MDKFSCMLHVIYLFSHFQNYPVGPISVGGRQEPMELGVFNSDGM